MLAFTPPRQTRGKYHRLKENNRMSINSKKKKKENIFFIRFE
jgi:hypothetical protein